MRLLLNTLMLAAALALAGCATNHAQQTGYVDHNNDLPYWEQ